jgi:hypothetical protein
MSMPYCTASKASASGRALVDARHNVGSTLSTIGPAYYLRVSESDELNDVAIYRF